MAFVSVTSNILMGLISSRTRLKYLLAIMNAAIFFSVIGVIYLDTKSGVLLYIIGNGIAGGGFACLSGIVWPRFFGRKWLGSISGVGMSSMVIGSGIGPLLFGAFLQRLEIIYLSYGCVRLFLLYYFLVVPGLIIHNQK